MKARAFQKSHGKHGYAGKYSSRGKRFMSKIYKGLDVDHKAVQQAFERIEKERCNNAR